MELDKGQRAKLGEDRSSTVIFEAELCAMVLAFVVWKEKIASRPVVHYVDNNAARDVLIKGAARNDVGYKLAKLFLTIEDLARVFTWVTRVPSPSNIADEPSRKIVHEFAWNGRQLRATDCAAPLDEILTIAE